MTQKWDKMKVLGNAATGLSSAGTTLATATTCTADHVTVTTVTEGQGVKLAPGNSYEFRSVANHSTTANLLVYPPTSSGQLNGKTAGDALTLPASSAAFFFFFSANNISVMA